MSQAYAHNWEEESRSCEGAGKESSVMAGTVENKTEGAKLALKCIKLKTAKEWALIFSLSERTCQRWISGEANLPKAYIPTVIRAVKGYFLEIQGLETAIDHYLLGQRGDY